MLNYHRLDDMPNCGSFDGVRDEESSSSEDLIVMHSTFSSQFLYSVFFIIFYGV
jgi:hypothetical protein